LFKPLLETIENSRSCVSARNATIATEQVEELLFEILQPSDRVLDELGDLGEETLKSATFNQHLPQVRKPLTPGCCRSEDCPLTRCDGVPNIFEHASDALDDLNPDLDQVEETAERRAELCDLLVRGLQLVSEA